MAYIGLDTRCLLSWQGGAVRRGEITLDRRERPMDGRDTKRFKGKNNQWKKHW